MGAGADGDARRLCAAERRLASSLGSALWLRGLLIRLVVVSVF
jgi:hypothetical protein